MKPWDGPNGRDRLLVFAPHPDDESLMAGGTIQRTLKSGGQATVVFVSDGDNNPWVQRIAERRLFLGPDFRRRLGERRRQEAYAALATLGLPPSQVKFLGFPDRTITDVLLNRCESLMSPIEEVLARFDPTIIVVPALTDVHPDHNAVALAVTLALARRVSSAPQPLVLRSLIHGHRPKTNGQGILTLALDTTEQSRKRIALLSHRSQTSVWQRRFLSFAGPTETFTCEPGSATDLGRTKSQLQLRVNEELGRRFLELRPWRRFRGLPSTRFCFVGMDADGSIVRLAIRPSNLTVGGGLQESLDHGHRILRFPAHRLANCKPLFVKAGHRFGLFDSAGWCQARHETPSLTTRERRSTGLYAVIPCYNVAHLCTPVVREAARQVDLLIAVDDGSSDGTRAVLRKLAAEHPGRIRVLTFDRNRGKGEALLAAFCSALADHDCSTIVTLDGDGQHRATDIPALLAPLGRGADLIIGTRSAFGDMPLRSRLGNLVIGYFLRLCFPGCPTDTQSGFRALTRSFAETVVRDIHGRRYETELVMLLCALTRGWNVETVAIPTVYKDGNRSSHFRPLADSIRVAAAGLRWLVHDGKKGPSKWTTTEQAAPSEIEPERFVA